MTACHALPWWQSRPPFVVHATMVVPGAAALVGDGFLHSLLRSEVRRSVLRVGPCPGALYKHRGVILATPCRAPGPGLWILWAMLPLRHGAWPQPVHIWRCGLPRLVSITSGIGSAPSPSTPPPPVCPYPLNLSLSYSGL